MMRSNRGKYWLILGLFFFSFDGYLCYNYISLAEKKETVVNEKKLKGDEHLLLEKMEQLNISYSAFERSLNKFIDDLDKVNRKELSPNDVDYQNPREKLEQLKRATEQLREQLAANNHQEIDLIIQIIEKKLDPFFQLLGNKIDVKHLYKVQIFLNIPGRLNTNQQLNKAIIYLSNQNKDLKKHLKKANQTLDPSPIKGEVIIVILLTFWIFIFILIIIKDKILTRLYQYQSEENLFDKPELIEKHIEESIQGIDGLINQPFLPDNEAKYNEELENIKKSIEQIKAEIYQAQNILLLPPVEEFTAESIPQPPKLIPAKNEEFTLLYEELVLSYNQNPNFYAPNALRVSQTDETIINPNYERQKKPRLSLQTNGMYWLIPVKNVTYLVPIKTLKLNENNFQFFEELFICFGYQPDFSKRFKLLKPAVIRASGEEWELTEKGVLQFESGEYA
ncbi:hypothetical protein [Gloeothece verrucosa]|uniref:Uncharacterized protein n=1 Tax=Gloeothece verrucosa (strain PCC 7822) TaxID=497965 RepID=E0UNU5_GLOV7|nr:hypothetical protein [Gloeothece verrucosa]ADN18625.1 hypothetical protein Cyan7822_6676 [Gloeothece verrucosa PCC 7822]